MMILALVRNYIPSYQGVVEGGWNIADCASRSYDVEGMQVGTVAAGRIGSAVLRRLKPFEVGLHYTDRHRLPDDGRGGARRDLSTRRVESLVEVCDVVTINAPLHPETENLFNDELLAKMKRGAYLVNTARGKICDRDAIVRALESGQLAGYAGDVWFPQPAPRDHPWRSMPHHGMTPHISGTSLSAQARYAAGTREILECCFDGRPIREEYLIVDGGALAGAGAHSYSAGDATGGSEEAARFGQDRPWGASGSEAPQHPAQHGPHLGPRAPRQSARATYRPASAIVPRIAWASGSTGLGLDRPPIDELQRDYTEPSEPAPPSAPPLPPEHLQRSEQRLPGILLGQGLGGESLRELAFDLLEDGAEQVRLAVEVVVEGSSGDAGGSDELLGADPGIAPLGEQAAGGGDQAGLAWPPTSPSGSS